MKKLITWIITLTMILSLCACSGANVEQEAAPADGLQVGYAKIDITPSFEVGLAGYGDMATRKNSDGMTDYVYVTCIAVKEGEETVLLYTMDTLGIGRSRANSFRAAISPVTGIANNKIFFGATHSHNAPETDSDEYEKFVTPKLVEAAQKAIADLSPATMLATSVKTEGMNFVRHYKMKDGSYSGSNFGDGTLGYVEHATEVDPEMQIVKFDRGTEKKAVVMVNFQAHNDYAKNIGYNMISPGWVGAFRNKLESASGCNVAYFMGASGNVNASSRIESEAHGLDWQPYGEKLSQIAFDAMNNLQSVGGSGIVTTTYIDKGEVNHEWDHMIAEANEVIKLWQSAGKDAGDQLGKKYGFTSVYQANAIISRSKKPAYMDLEQSAVRIHNVGFIVGGYEMFCENGIAVKNSGHEAGYEHVFIIAGNSGYIPSEAAYGYRSYESDISNFVKGTAERMQDKYIELLSDIK